MYDGSYKGLDKIATQIKKSMRKYPGFSQVDSNLTWDSLQYTINVDRECAADVGVRVSDITNTLATMLGGLKVSEYIYQGKAYDIILQAPYGFASSPDNLQNFYVKSNSGKMISLNTLTTVKADTQPLVLPRFNKMHSEHIRANLNPGYTTGEAVREVQKILKQDLPAGANYQWFGQTRNYLQSQGGMLQAFGLALLFIYLFLAAQFESFIDPFIILITVPLSIIGALLTLKLTGNSLNIFSEIGLITLIGLISKHGIMITEFANVLRRQGQDPITAIITAAKLRLRPILMTTSAMVLGAIPLILASGGSAASQQQIGWVICGGLVFGTAFTLFVLPVIYCLVKPAETA